MRRLIRSIAAAALLVVLLWVLVAGPAAAASVPRDGSWQAIDEWYGDVGAAVAVMTVVRAVAVALGGWLLVACTLQALVSLPLLQVGRPLVDLLTPRHLQRLLHGAAGVSLAAAMAVPAPGQALPVEPPPDVAVMRVLDDESPTPTAAAPTAAAPTVVVQAGDSFWSIAEGHLRHLGVSTADAEVVQYWERLVAANVDELVDAGNPDLLYPGQALELPPV